MKTKLKRILVIGEHFPPAIGGTAQYLYNNCNFIADADFDLTLLCSHSEGCEDSDKSLPYKIIRLRLWSILKKSALWEKPFFNRVFRLILMLELFVIVLFKRFDILWLASFEQISIFALPLKKIKGFRLIVSLYGEEFQMFGKSPRSLKIMKRIFRTADCVTTLCTHWKKEALKFGVREKKIYVLPVAVDTTRFSPASDKASLRKSLGLDTEAPVLLTVARIVKRKGVDTVIKCLPELIKEFPALKYLVVGNGDYLAEVKRLAEDLSVSKHVIFVGENIAEDLPKYYQAADVFVHPNREIRETGETEGFGIVFIEANACGIPALGGNSGGTPDGILDGKTGYIVPPLETEIIIERISGILRDPKLRENMKKNAIMWADNFSLESGRRMLLGLLDFAAKE